MIARTFDCLNMFSVHAFIILCTGIWMIRSASGSTISDVSSINVTVGDTALIPWDYSLTGGQTVDEIIWTKLPATPVLTVRTGSPTPIYGTGYSTRASTTAGTAYLQLTNIVSSDQATYRCQIVFDDLTQVEDEAQLFVTVDGGWSNWSPWSACSVTCGDGTQTRDRTCTNPAPANGGADCVGQPQESTTCLAVVCPVDGSWSDWGSWSVCSVTCGNGTRTRSRTCTNPAPSNGGADCVGDAQETSPPCNTQPCPSDNTIAIAIPVAVVVVITVVAVGAGTFYWKIKLKKKGLMRLELHILHGLKLEVHWIAPRGYEEATYQVVYRSKGSDGDPTFGPDLSGNNPPNYTDTVTFPACDTYELYVLVKNGQTKKKSDIEEISIEGLMRLKLRRLPGRNMEVEWTAPPGYEGARYQVAYKPTDWIRVPDASTNDPPNYKYTVSFPQAGHYEVCVFVIEGRIEKQSDIEKVSIVPDIEEVTIGPKANTGLMRLQLHPLPENNMEVEWTAPPGYKRASYQVAYRPDDWTRGPDVATNDPPNYNYIVTFPHYARYVVCVFVKGQIEKQSDVERVIIRPEDTAVPGSPNGSNMVVSPLHGNNTPKTDSHVVFMTTDGRSPPLRLEPLQNEQNPAVKKEKKKKKRKKVNKVNASDEETKPEV